MQYLYADTTQFFLGGHVTVEDSRKENIEGLDKLEMRLIFGAAKTTLISNRRLPSLRCLIKCDYLSMRPSERERLIGWSAGLSLC